MYRLALRLLSPGPALVPGPRPCPALWDRHRLHVALLVGAVRRQGTAAAASAAVQDARPLPSAPAGLSYLHHYAEDPLLYLTLGQMVERAAGRFGTRAALVSVEEGVRLSFAELLERADRLAAGLVRLGLQRGDRVAIWAPNSWRWVVAKIGIARAGMVSVDMNSLYREAEVRHCLSLARVAAVVTAGQQRDLVYHHVLAAVVPELTRSDPSRIRSAALPDLKAVISMLDTAPPGCLTFDGVSTSASPEEVKAIADLGSTISPDEGSYIQFSSGTTGKPKAILLSHAAVVNNGYFNGKRFGFHRKHHTICLQTPLFHVYGSIVITSSALNHGATVVLASSAYSPKAAIAAAGSERCTMMTGTPTMYVDLVRAVQEGGPGSAAALETVELAATGGAPITPEFVRRMKAVLGVSRICSVYGLSETAAVVFQGQQSDTDDQVAETVGHISEHVEAKVVDADGKMVPFGSPGELWVRGYFSMIGYFQNEEATRKTLVDGWVRTGDKFVLQEDGYGRIVGRLKDMIIRGGENIYPKEVEDMLTLHPDIREAEVVGVPDERMGEELCACLKVVDGKTVTASDIRAFLKNKAASYKMPRYSVTLPDFPKTASGKIQKFKLRDDCARLLAEGGLDDSRRHVK